MRAFLQSSMTVLLGLCLLYAFYQKKKDHSQLAQATDITMDSSFFVSQPIFEVKQPSTQSKSAIAAGLPAADIIDSLNVSGMQDSETSLKKTIKVKPKIEIYELKKAPKTNVAHTQLVNSRLQEAISQKKEESVTEEAATASITDANSATESAIEQPQTEKKKKFLFFSKKNRNN